MLDIKKLLTKILTSFVPKAGGTMTGALTMNAKIVNAKSSNITKGTYPDEQSFGNSSFRLQDSAGNTLAILRGVTSPTFMGLNLAGFNEDASGINSLYIGYDENGNRKVIVTNSGDWRNALGLPTHIEDRGSGSATLVANSGASSNASTVTKRSGIAVLLVNFKLDAGTYGTSNYLLTVSPVPTNATRATILVGSAHQNMRLNTSGQLFFNSSYTVSSTVYVLGQIVYAY